MLAIKMISDKIPPKGIIMQDSTATIIKRLFFFSSSFSSRLIFFTINELSTGILFIRESTEILYKLLSFTKSSILGILCPVSHFETDCLDIFKYMATSAWVKLFFFLYVIKFLLISIHYPPLLSSYKFMLIVYQIRKIKTSCIHSTRQQTVALVIATICFFHLPLILFILVLKLL